MLDPKLLRNDFEKVAAALKRKKVSFEDGAYLSLEKKRKLMQTETEELQAKSKQLAKEIGTTKDEDKRAPLLEQGAAVKRELEEKSRELSAIQSDLEKILSNLPNLPHESVPDGEDETGNLEVRSWGEKPSFSFAPIFHLDIAEKLGLVDMEAAAGISGSRFMLLYGVLARMHRALAQFMLDFQTRKNGYKEVYVPYVANSDSVYGTGQLPKFKEDLFKLEETDYYLVPTAEIPLTNIYRNRVLDSAELPVKLVANTPCFRSEAGSYGKDTRGLIRQHQFEKVELVQIVAAGESWAALENLTADAEAILRELELPYRVVTLCAGDLGFASAKTYDLEVWLPAEGKYREISSCSNMTDFQSRRMQMRVRNPKSNKPELAHTLNGSGLAIGRTLVAIMENYQTENGEIGIPSALQPYMDGQTLLALEA